MLSMSVVDELHLAACVPFPKDEERSERTERMSRGDLRQWGDIDRIDYEFVDQSKGYKA